ncbi:MAG: protoheme IX farnesyltransferase, partial [Paracoccus sp. (in: a-proteobacteria)]|nr:protoheme IX farnesyltransferase [Paracoccus sp. (in: a-proteobacteria)]
TLVLAAFSIGLGLTSVGGPLYMAVAIVLNLAFIQGGWRILRRGEETAIADGFATERQVFKLSLTYLFLHFLALLIQNWIGTW